MADPTPIPAEPIEAQYLADVQAVAEVLAHRLYDFTNGAAIGQAAEMIVTSEWLARRDERMLAAGRTAAATNLPADFDPDVIAWLLAHGLEFTASPARVLAVARRDVLGVCPATHPADEAARVVADATRIADGDGDPDDR